MNWLVGHIAGGGAFFSGIFLLITSSTAGLLIKGKLRRAATPFGIVGGLLLLVSATPVSIVYVVCGIVTLIVAISFRFTSKGKRHQTIATLPFITTCVVGLFCELPYHLAPSIKSVGAHQLTIFGDSLTASPGSRNSKRWPELLADEQGILVVDHAHVGATANSALEIAKDNPPKAGVVLVEIGGNDILGSTPAANFEESLDKLLETVSESIDLVVMFEMPLPPFYNEFGRIQRELAAKHGVKLIPKRVLMSLLASNGATLDSIHLSPEGHRRFADIVWKVAGSAFGEK